MVMGDALHWVGVLVMDVFILNEKLVFEYLPKLTGSLLRHTYLFHLYTFAAAQVLRDMCSPSMTDPSEIRPI